MTSDIYLVRKNCVVIWSRQNKNNNKIKHFEKLKKKCETYKKIKFFSIYVY